MIVSSGSQRRPNFEDDKAEPQVPNATLVETKTDSQAGSSDVKNENSDEEVIRPLKRKKPGQSKSKSGLKSTLCSLNTIACVHDVCINTE